MVVLALVAGWLAWRHPAGALLPGADPAVLAVLPFEVRGSDQLGYLREGMIDLVSTKLDGVG